MTSAVPFTSIPRSGPFVEMDTRWFYVGLVMLVLLACRGGEDESADDGDTRAVATQGDGGPAPPAPVPASEQLIGVWEHVSDVGGTEVRLGLTFAPDALVRSTGGVETARQAWSIVAESESEVTADVTDADGRVARHTWRIVTAETLVHTATPDVVFARVGNLPPPPDGEGSGEGSGATSP